MTKNAEFKNTFVIGFDDLDDPKRQEVVKLLLSSGEGGRRPDWVLFASTDNVLDDKGVKPHDQFRHLNDGYYVTVIDTAYSYTQNEPFAVCHCWDTKKSEKENICIDFDELLDTKIYGKMNQNKDVTDEQ